MYSSGRLKLIYKTTLCEKESDRVEKGFGGVPSSQKTLDTSDLWCFTATYPKSHCFPTQNRLRPLTYKFSFLDLLGHGHLSPAITLFSGLYRLALVWIYVQSPKGGDCSQDQSSDPDPSGVQAYLC